MSAPAWTYPDWIDTGAWNTSVHILDRRGLWHTVNRGGAAWDSWITMQYRMYP